MPHRMTDPMATRHVVVFVTCPNLRRANVLAKGVIAARLAACVNIVPGISSVFWWKGRVDQANEVLLLMKTTRRLLPSLTRLVLRLHPYDLPEVIALPIAAGHPPYLAWISDSVAASSSR